MPEKSSYLYGYQMGAEFVTHFGYGERTLKEFIKFRMDTLRLGLKPVCSAWYGNLDAYFQAFGL